MLKKCFLILSVLIFGFSFLGNIFFWTDKDGVRHYSNVYARESYRVKEFEETKAVYQQLNLKNNQTQTFEVLKVYDGDTIQVKGLGLVFKIRMVGIDAPEIGYRGEPSQAFSQKSKRYLQSLVDKKRVRLTSHGIGGYNRQLAEIFVNDINVNLEIIRAGLAEVYQGKRPKTLKSEVYLQEEKKAKKARIGMWVQSSSYQSPRQWRKDHPWK